MKILGHSIRIVPLILVMGTIFFLSHQTATELQLPFFPGLDKLAHAVAYAFLAAATIYALPKRMRMQKSHQTAVMVVLFCLAYGVSDEYHQSFVPGREPSLGDVLADAVGSALLVYFWLKRNRSGGAEDSIRPKGA